MNHINTLITKLQPSQLYIIPPIPRQHQHYPDHYDNYNATAYLLTLMLHDTLHGHIQNGCLINTLHLKLFKDMWATSSRQRNHMYTEYYHRNNSQFIHLTESLYKDMYKEVILQITQNRTTATTTTTQPSLTASSPPPPPNQQPSPPPPADDEESFPQLPSAAGPVSDSSQWVSLFDTASGKEMKK